MDGVRVYMCDLIMCVQRGRAERLYFNTCAL